MIRQLPEHLVNQIAAGEVVERPASALKELIENALDAGASHIRITLEAGGLEGLIVADNGKGMDGEDLKLSVARHATSKLADENLFAIKHFGFRGEALPSIASVSRLTITTRTKACDHGWQLVVRHGKAGAIGMSAQEIGTKVQIEEFFTSVPARLKFLKSGRAEAGQSIDIVKRLAMSRPDIAFDLTDSGKPILNLPARSADKQGYLDRLSQLLGAHFAKDAIQIEAQREDIELTGLAGLPTMNRPTTSHIYLFVNGRAVRDRQLIGAVRAGYQDMLPRGRHPILALFLNIPPHKLDVNVHPAKAEVRFSDAQAVRALIVGSLSSALRARGVQANSEASQTALRQFSPSSFSSPSPLSSSQAHAQNNAPSYASTTCLMCLLGRVLCMRQLHKLATSLPPMRLAMLIMMSILLSILVNIHWVRHGLNCIRPIFWRRHHRVLFWLINMLRMSV